MKAEFEKIEHSGNSSFKAYGYQVNSFQAPWHFHPEYELTYISESKGIRYVGDSIQKFQQGDLVLIGSYLPHCWKNPDKNSSAQSMVVQWNDDFIGAGTFNKPEFKKIKTLLTSADKGLKFDDKASVKLGKELIELQEKEPFEKMISFLCILRKLCDTSCCSLSGNTFSKHQMKTIASSRIDVVQNYVSTHYEKRIKLKVVADLVSLTEQSFCKFFKQTMGRSFFNYLNEFRINVACQSLLESREEIIMISSACGYESLPFFYRQFKKYKHISPHAYRKRYNT